MGTADVTRGPVAPKLTRSGVTRRAAMRRFEYEARLLGKLRHSGIAQVYQAGGASRG